MDASAENVCADGDSTAHEVAAAVAALPTARPWRRQHIAENTIDSLVTASGLGAAVVEFDVQVQCGLHLFRRSRFSRCGHLRLFASHELPVFRCSSLYHSR
jgi:hypothetical protein